MLAADRQEAQHRFPSMLPDGRHFLYQGRSAAEHGVFLGEVGCATPRVPLVEADSSAVFVPGEGSDAGLIVYDTNGHLIAHRFDPRRLALVGQAQPLAIDVGPESVFHPSMFSASSRLLAYAGQLPFGNEIKVASPDGRAGMILLALEEQQWPRVSPDGSKLAWLQVDKLQGPDTWVMDLVRGTRTRITSTPERELAHVWSPDGLQLAYRPDVGDRKRISIVAADGSGSSTDLLCPRGNCEPTDWPADGRELIVNAYEPGNVDVWAVAVGRGGRTRALLDSRYNERDARVSPNHRWLAYVSEELDGLRSRSEAWMRLLPGATPCQSMGATRWCGGATVGRYST